MNNQFKLIKPEEISDNPFTLLNEDWMLITAGTKEKFNTMTASWGGVGVLWNKKVAFIFVRPPRYTFEFIENSSYFSLSFFAQTHKKALQYCGSHSGRGADKIKATGLSPIYSGDYIAFDEAKLILECKKIYFNDLLPAHFIDPKIDSHYPKHDYHRMYIGEIHQVYLRSK